MYYWSKELVKNGRKVVITENSRMAGIIEFFITRYEIRDGLYWDKVYGVWYVQDYINDDSKAIKMAEKWLNREGE